MPRVIRILGFANGAHCPHAGEYLEAFDFEAFDGRGFMETTPDVDKALKFADLHAAVLFTMTVPVTKPVREDGRPNRPLTAAHIEVVPV